MLSISLNKACPSKYGMENKSRQGRTHEWGEMKDFTLPRTHKLARCQRHSVHKPDPETWSLHHMGTSLVIRD